MFDKPGVVPLYRTLKLLRGLNQKGTWPGAGAQRSPATDDAPPAQRHDLTRSVMSAERGKPVALPAWGRQAVRPTDGAAGKGRGSKRRPVGNGPDRGCDMTPPERGQTSPGCRRARTVSQPAQAVMQRCRRGRNGPCWCSSRHRRQLGSRHCRSNAQVGPKANGATACLRRRVGRCLSGMRGNQHVPF
jgi:hypothetical protein